MSIKTLRIASAIFIVATVVVGVITLFSADGALGGLAVSLAAIAVALSALTVILARRGKSGQPE